MIDLRLTRQYVLLCGCFIFSDDNVPTATDEDEESESEEIQFSLTPNGIDIFKNDMYQLYTAGTGPCIVVIVI